MESDHNVADGQYPQRVDPGALALATVAGAVAFILGPGEWDLLATVIGGILFVILMAHHRPAPVARTPRSYLLRAAFGVTTGLAVCMLVAPAIQFGIVEPFFPEFDDEGYFVGGAYTTTLVIGVLWGFVAFALAAFEPRIARWLDRPRRSTADSGARES